MESESIGAGFFFNFLKSKITHINELSNFSVGVSLELCC